MDIYVDIDGVLLANENNLANYAEEFIEYLVNNYTVYWLTTHCMDNDASLAVQNVGRFCKPEIVELLHKIKPTSWKVAKTEAIDFSQPFLWIDDDLYPDEKEVLIENGCLDSWIEVDLSQDENALQSLISKLRGRLLTGHDSNV